MARLLILTAGFEQPLIELCLGVNFFGRHPANDVRVDHPTISGRHCEIELGLDQITIRDCNSTNGTFLDGERITEGVLKANQKLRLGDVEMLVDNVDVRIAIPKIEVPAPPPPPVFLDDGSMLCQEHPEARVTHRCTHCQTVMCGACVRHLRRRGGKILKLCRSCSHTVEPLTAEEKKKRTLMSFLRTTIKMPFVRKAKQD
jgi:pSer/pThr/pTyr-binding forkhead associated (FHA) protein